MLAPEVLIVSYGEPRALAPLFASLRAQTLRPSAIRVWHNGPAEPPAKDLLGEAGAELHGSGENLGFGEGINRLSALVQADVAVICNPDLSLDANCIARLSAALDADEAAVVAGGALASDRTPPTVNAFALRLTWDLLGINTDRGEPFDSFLANADPRSANSDSPGANNSSRLYLGPSGALFAVHLPRYRNALGGPLFVSSLFLYLEDVALWLRLRICGAKILFCRDAHAVHGWSASVGQRSARKLYFVERNRLWIVRALRGRAAAIALLPFTALRYFSYLARGRQTATPSSSSAGVFDLLRALSQAVRDGLCKRLPPDLSNAFSIPGAPQGGEARAGKLDFDLGPFTAGFSEQLRNPVE